MRVLVLLLVIITWSRASCAMGNIEFLKSDHQSILSLGDYKGKVVLIVNTASRCGFANQYSELEELWSRYKDKGLMIIAVPSNDFMSQEPDTDSQIQQVCRRNFGVTFPVVAKVHVTGRDRHPFFNEVRSQLGLVALPRWNFYKYIVSKDGKLVEWFTSFTSPLSPKITTVVEKQIAQMISDES